MLLFLIGAGVVYADLGPSFWLEYRSAHSPLLFQGFKASTSIISNRYVTPDFFSEAALTYTQTYPTVSDQSSLSFPSLSLYSEYLFTPQLDTGFHVYLDPTQSAITTGFVRLFLSAPVSLGLSYNSLAEQKYQLLWIVDPFFIDYSYWFRENPRHTIQLGNLHDLWSEWELWTGFSYVSQTSKDPAQTISDTSFSIALIWEPEGLTTRDPASYFREDYLFETAKEATDQGHYDLAEKRLLRVQLFDPESARISFELGNLYHHRQLYETAVSYFKAAIERDPDLLEAYYLLSYDLLQLHRNEEAQTTLKQLYEKNSDPLIKKLLR